MSSTYRYRFTDRVPAEEVEVTLLLALIGAEALHGAAQARLDAAHAFDGNARTVTIDAGSAVGIDLNKLFAGYLAREFGDDAFRIERLNQQPQPREPVTA
ncbi:hypothetical protein GobsT_51610 [Gemmata obscuriglobus]|uniref:Uncharacterized protein n=1 Tax=Gemmata obscuriglobus TaxID=114 RepID=A0A2Z3GRH2_9BACT|nr:hypothetical protein [Gemmata obscuriglobus]AWM36959.1 hypothetical protein C1280_07955 [Gemmata obscuriglobus]QEG30356.1 hypothetical protein GobsT_51610 [Gemmata obscuriglobus]VTS09680.1 Uncharacterized protein OS=Syntrophobacter fumaroxidans (strain DSM 10017 / MPOB) GN=Sfum_3784 PE=4 SV=1 [Gemmata obscuriglobus UQM 2246]